MAVLSSVNLYILIENLLYIKFQSLCVMEGEGLAQGAGTKYLNINIFFAFRDIRLPGKQR